MDRNVRKAALRAAAKTAIALSLTGAHLLSSGCAELHRSSPRELDASATLDAELGVDAMQVSMRDMGTPDSGVDSGVLECDEYLASLELVASRDRWPEHRFTDPDRLHPRTGECCREIEDRLNRGEPSGVSEYTARACCETPIVDPQSPVLGCYPWGPPCPPAMPVLA